MWFLQKWWPWPWSLSDLHQNNLPGSLELSTSAVKISERLNQWCGLYIVQLRTDRQTNRQTDRQTNRGDQYTLQKSTILQSNKPRWPIYFAKIYAKRRLAYTNINYPPIGISSRINLQPTRSLYDFRFKSYGWYDDFHGFVMCLTLIFIFQDYFIFVNSPCSDA